MQDNSTSQEKSQSQNSEFYRDFKGLWIPREIWLNPKLLPLEKCLWAEIHSLHSRKKKGCFASREYLANFFCVSERYVKKMLSRLRDMDLIEDVSFNGRQKVIRAKLPPETYGEEFTSAVNCSSPLPCPTVHPSDEPQFPSNLSRVISTTYSKEDNKGYKDNAQSPASQSSELHSKHDFFFCHQLQKYVGITKKDIASWKKFWPSINIENVVGITEEWLRANPAKAKRKKLWRKFITLWLTKENEKIENKVAWREMNKSSKSNSKENSHLRIDQENKPSGWKPADAIR